MVLDKKIPDITRDERMLLSSLKKRPGMYLGKTSLTGFVNWFYGYRTALKMTKLYSERIIIPDGLLEYAAIKYLGHTKTSKGWFTLILEKEPDEKKALEIFWELLDEYLVSLGYEPIPEWEDIKDNFNEIFSKKGESYHA